MVLSSMMWVLATELCHLQEQQALGLEEWLSHEEHLLLQAEDLGLIPSTHMVVHNHL